MPTSKVITRSGKTMLATLLKNHVKHAAFTTGDGTWGDPPPGADFELNAPLYTTANHEIGRVPVLSAAYLEEDPDGTIQFDSRHWSVTTEETNILRFEFLLPHAHANGSQIRQVAFFGDAEDGEIETITTFVPWMAPPPAFTALSSETTGGSLPVDDYRYVIVGRNPRGRTLPSQTRTIQATAAAARNVLTFTLNPYTDQYEIYRGKGFGDLDLLYTSPTGESGTITWIDDGSLTPDTNTHPPSTATARSLGQIGRLFAVENRPPFAKTSDDEYRRFLNLVL